MRPLQKPFGALLLGCAICMIASQAISQDPSASGEGTTLNEGAEGKAFQALLRDFDQWAAVQLTYDAGRVKSLRAALIEKASSLTGSEYEIFLDDLHGRLQVLLSAEAREARKWLDNMLARSAPKRVAKIKSQLPEVAQLTASELEEQLYDLDRKRGARVRQNEAFNSDREHVVDEAQAVKRRQEEASRAAQRATSQATSNLGANHPSTAPKEKSEWRPREPVWRSHDAYTPIRGNGYAPYTPARGESYSPYSPNLGGYRW